jgi:hypothetical protein
MWDSPPLQGPSMVDGWSPSERADVSTVRHLPRPSFQNAAALPGSHGTKPMKVAALSVFAAARLQFSRSPGTLLTDLSPGRRSPFE